MDFSKTNKLVQWSLYHSRTIWLFTRSDLKTIVIPSTLFAVLYTSSEVFSGSSSVDTNIWTLCRSLFATGLWIWINLLPFTIDNQRQPGSIKEDAENKPWRPLPARRITPGHAAALMVFFYVAAILVSVVLGATVQCLALIILGSCYNHLRGNDSMLARNVLNGCGYMCFTSGALEVMVRSLSISTQTQVWPWIFIIGAVVSTSIHMMDIPDQVGDRVRNRRTIPLVYGDSCARRSVALAVAVWSLCCPAFWRLGATGFLVPVVLGSVVVSRVLTKRTVEADKGTSKLYNLWIAGLFSLPMVHGLQVMLS